MKYRVAKFGTGRHIILPKEFNIGESVDVQTPEGEELTENRVREIVKEEIESLRREY